MSFELFSARVDKLSRGTYYDEVELLLHLSAQRNALFWRHGLALVKVNISSVTDTQKSWFVTC